MVNYIQKAFSADPGRFLEGFIVGLVDREESKGNHLTEYQLKILVSIELEKFDILRQEYWINRTVDRLLRGGASED